MARPRGRRARPAWIADGDDEWLSASERTDRDEFWHQVLRARLVATFAIPAALAALAVFGPNRLALAAITAVAGLLSNLALWWRIRNDRGIPAGIAVADLLTALLILAALPRTYTIGIVVIVSMTTVYVFWFGRRTTVRLAIATGLALLAIGLWRQPELWLASWVAWLITSTLGTVVLANVARVSIESRTRYNDLVNGIDALVWEGRGARSDADYVSERVVGLLGYTPEDFSSFSFLASHTHPDDIEELMESRRQVAAGHDVEVHYRLRDATARTRHLHERITVSRDADGAVVHRRGVVIDETARTEAERSVRGYADFIEGLPLALAILRLDDLDDPESLRVVTGNPSSARLAGREPSETIGRLLVDLLPDTRRLLPGLADVVRHGAPLQHPNLRVGPNDDLYSLQALPLPDQCIGVSLEDVTVRARAAASLRHQALHDHLTGLPNRARFNDRLATALATHDDVAAAHGGDAEHQTALVMIDLNQFKEVNDTLGHEYGDRLLVELSRRLSRHLRGCDTIARLGGDEFAILLTGPGAGHAADGVAQRVQELSSEPFRIDNYRLQVGASIGIAVFPDHADDAATLMRHADGAMYTAKAAGGGIVRYSSGHDLANSSKLELLAELRTAVQSDEMVVHYQPRLDLTSLQTLGVEALVRWRHPQRGLLAPGEFIELAEVSGTIAPLTRLVTERATSDLHHLGSGADLSVNINLSGRNLHDPMLVTWVTELLDRTGFPASSLCFELTETQLTADPAQALETLHRLHLLGVRLSVDDFGTGYSSLAYLRELPLDEVKIDPSFIADLEHGDTTLVRSVIQLGHNLGLHVVAEGVETPAALEELRRLGCDSAQGFHFAMPMSLPDLERFLDEAALEHEDELVEHSDASLGPAAIAGS
ncbi:MAG: putative bifunctional diguanylate cyclase/phosphodiesterase [Microthrixaceae bacterium]